jgi:hypothetical protein
MVTYYDAATNDLLCTAHQFECEHGQILASGFPDPKFFYKETITLVADPEHFDGDTCSPQCSLDRAATEAARNGPLAQYRQHCDRCAAWLAQQRR